MWEVKVGRERVKHFSVPLLLFFLLILLSIEHIRAESGRDTLVIAYTANLNANLQPCGCGDVDLGGLTRIAGVVEKLREKYPDLVLLDAGDWLNSFPLTETDTLVAKILGSLPYTAINLGDQEFVEGEGFLTEIKKRYGLPLLSASFQKWDSSKGQPGVLFKTVSGFKLLIYAYCSPKTFTFLEPPQISEGFSGRILSDFPANLAEQTDLMVILAHDRILNLPQIQLPRKIPQIWIAGHTQERIAIETESGLVLEPGMDGEYLGLLKVFRNSRGKLNWKNTFLPMDEQITESGRVKMMVTRFFRMLSTQPQ
ncbi:MAG: hypothetical protein Kow0037_09100 [Calditrichia bacterium]